VFGLAELAAALLLAVQLNRCCLTAKNVFFIGCRDRVQFPAFVRTLSIMAKMPFILSRITFFVTKASLMAKVHGVLMD